MVAGRLIPKPDRRKQQTPSKRAKAEKPDKTLFGDKDHMAPVNPTPMKRVEGSERGDLVPDYGG